MDGTLLTGSTASLQIARHTGTEAQLRALEARFAAEEIDTKTFSTALYAIWRDGLTPATVASAYAGSPWLSGIGEVCADIRARGEHSLVITMSPDFFARHLLELGFDEVVASRFPPLPLAGPPEPGDILTPADKVAVADRVRAGHGLGVDRCIAYGDSMSDAPLFRHLPHTVAVNADHHLADIAALDYRGDDLAGAYALGRTLLTRDHQAQ
ncbi:HAD family hydrolase [Actinomadura rupiterrae]|uniref:HAD family hydrolase n=1 Tax=Actinomadura rupiterrae TaxID=559627 RepID=UPI00264692CF|nr:haloacid dehalogenase-like hydrolase [Actinomadura rupiterrae]MCP2343276.1 phosphoserine phosphatase [Actinomadura rupiterrae]